MEIWFRRAVPWWRHTNSILETWHVCYIQHKWGWGLTNLGGSLCGEKSQVTVILEAVVETFFHILVLGKGKILINIHIWTNSNLCHSSKPDMEKALPSWVPDIEVFDLVILMSIRHIQSGFHLLSKTNHKHI